MSVHSVGLARGEAQALQLREESSQLAILDDHFARERLAKLLGTEDDAALSLARRATHAPLAEVLARPGKGFRARLVAHAHAIAHEASCGIASHALPAALPQLLELLHVGSLIVDDVEDDARLRRGAPALHRQIGTALAINSGNFLYFLPLLALEDLGLDDARTLALHRQIARSLTRCHHGQALDLSLRISDLDRAEIAAAVQLASSLKTGALLELACAAGAIAAGAPRHIADALARFGCETGVALQMFDDLSGFLNPARREKALEDLIERRPTWAWALTAACVDEATFTSWQRLSREVALGNCENANALVSAMAPHLEPLRFSPRARLEAALAELQNTIGEWKGMSALAQELRGLEHGYV